VADIPTTLSKYIFYQHNEREFMTLEEIIETVTRIQAEKLVNSTVSFHNELIYSQVELPLIKEIKQALTTRFESLQLSK